MRTLWPLRRSSPSFAACVFLPLSLLLPGSSDARLRFLAGRLANVFEPDGDAVGVAFLMTGAMSPVSLYCSTTDVLLGQGRIVVGVVSNVLFPLWGDEDGHRYRARGVPLMFDALREERPELPNEYAMVGHSAGGKASLLVAAVYDPERARVIVALDPVDQCPPEFTNGDPEKDETLSSSNANVTIVLTQSGIYDESPPVAQFRPEHNAGSIHAANNATTILVRHANSSHAAYTDATLGQGGLWDLIIPPGDPEANAAAKKDAHDLIRTYVN